MRVLVTIDGQEHECSWPYPSAQYVEAPQGARCPHCTPWPALLGGDGRVLALARSRAGWGEAQHTFPHATIQVPVQPPEWWWGQQATGNEVQPASCIRLRMPSFTTEHDRYTGDAVCCRCGLVAGPMQVVVSTLFGLEEDRNVTAGRCRVY